MHETIHELYFSRPNQNTSMIFSPTTIAAGLDDLGNVVVFDESVQPKASSPCQVTDNLKKTPCTQLCFAAPGSQSPLCACARGVLKGRSCEGISKSFFHLDIITKSLYENEVFILKKVLLGIVLEVFHNNDKIPSDK